MKKGKIIVVMPAYNAEKTIEKTVRDIPGGLVYKIIVVDDHSRDETERLAKKLGLTVFAHPNNLGYGGNQKTCYWEALKEKPDVVVMLHPDYQYDASRLHELVAPILAGKYDIMIGSRIRTRAEALAGGMPLIKYILNRIVSTIENIILGVNLTEHLSGLRAYSRRVLEAVPFQRFSNDFVFDQQFLISAITYGFSIGETPVPVRYFSESSSIGYFRGGKFLLETFWYLWFYILHTAKIIKIKLYS